ncbi:MAG: hypothetical protein ABI769_06495 [Pseudomonadota bacterium]
MNAFRAGFFGLASLSLLLALQAPAHADVRALRPTQTLPHPSNPSYKYFGVGVAIDGPNIIVLAINDGVSGAPNTYAALLYRRNSSTGNWVYRRTLVTVNGFFARMDVRMRNGIAAVQFGGQVSLFEYAGGDYVPAHVAAPIQHPGGVAISGNRVLVGGDGCNYDAVVYEKGTNGNWDITGRLDDNAGSNCDAWGTEVELNYDYALVRPHYSGVTTAWRRNGSAIDWVPAGALNLPPETPQSTTPYALQGATAVANTGHVFRRTGTSTWTPQGRATSVDHDASFGVTFDAVYRDGVLLTTESGYTAFMRAYLEASPGHFEHVASLITQNITTYHDISGRTAVAVAQDAQGTRFEVDVFTLPAPLRAPNPIVNDFEDRDVADFTFNSGQFALATRGSDDVLAQSSTSTLAIALVDGTDWAAYQRVEAEITPTFGASDSWVGLIARYVDANNYYFGAVRPDNSFGLYKRVNGVNTLLREGYSSGESPARAALVVDGSTLSMNVGYANTSLITDTSLTHGPAGLATWQARADFDDVRVAGTEQYSLFYRDWGFTGSDYEVGLTTSGGDWRVRQDEEGTNQGLGQFDASGSAVAFIGTPVGNQEVVARVRLDAFGASQQGAWFGLLARYTDSSNHYYVTVRSTGQIQIRKIVNGVITVLASTNFTAVPGQYYELRFRVINDQLQALVDQVLVASAHDSAIAIGQYGMATYRAATTWEYFSAAQP